MFGSVDDRLAAERKEPSVEELYNATKLVYQIEARMFYD